MLALIFFIAFPYLIWNLWKTLKTARASTSWPTVSGTITKVERFKRLFRSLPRVNYTYSVDGKSYNAERISFAPGYRSKEVDEIMNRYRVGQAVPVSYPPEKPAEGVLQPGPHPQIIASIRMFTICFVILLILNVVRYFLPT